MGEMQGGLSNAELLAAWQKKLPGVEPSERELSAFAVGVEVGFDHARQLEKADWMRIHYVLKDAGIHPGRTDDHLADVIARALIRPSLQDRIKELIAQHGTLRAASRAVQVDVGYMSRMEKGEKENPSATVLRRLGLREVTTYERLARSTPTT